MPTYNKTPELTPKLALKGEINTRELYDRVIHLETKVAALEVRLDTLIGIVSNHLHLPAGTALGI